MAYRFYCLIWVKAFEKTAKILRLRKKELLEKDKRTLKVLTFRDRDPQTNTKSQLLEADWDFYRQKISGAKTWVLEANFEKPVAKICCGSFINKLPQMVQPFKGGSYSSQDPPQIPSATPFPPTNPQIMLKVFAFYTILLLMDVRITKFSSV